MYRLEFTNTLTPEKAPSATDPLGGGNEWWWQLTGGTETMTVTRVAGCANQNGPGDVVLAQEMPVLPNNHGPRTDRLVYGLGAFKGYHSGDATSLEAGLYNQAFVGFRTIPHWTIVGPLQFTHSPFHPAGERCVVVAFQL